MVYTLKLISYYCSMEIIVKEQQNENHIYLMDGFRPCTIEIASKEETKKTIENLVINNDVTKISFTDKIDNTKKPNYFNDSRF